MVLRLGPRNMTLAKALFGEPFVLPGILGDIEGFL